MSGNLYTREALFLTHAEVEAIIKLGEGHEGEFSERDAIFPILKPDRVFGDEAADLRVVLPGAVMIKAGRVI